MKIWICGKFGIWNWIDVVLTIDSLSVVRATLPLPDIFVGRELSEANQVGTAIALMVEFTSSLIEDELEESIIIGKVTAPYIRCSGTLSDEIDPVDGSLLARGDDRRGAGIRATIPIIPAGSLDTSHTLGIQTSGRVDSRSRHHHWLYWKHLCHRPFYWTTSLTGNQ